MTARLDKRLIGLIVILLAFFGLTLLAGPKAASAPETDAAEDVRGGGYAAWVELLQRTGARPVVFRRRAVFLDRTTRELILAEPADGEYDPPSPRESTAIRAWVRAGGTLVELGGGEGLLERSYFARRRRSFAPDPSPGATSLPARKAIAPAATLRNAGITRVTIAQPTDTIAGLASDRYDLPLLADKRGRAVARERRVGKGRIIQIADSTIFTNRYIGTSDHARFAVWIGAFGRGGDVAFDEAVHGAVDDVPWWQTLPYRVDAAIALAGAALFLALFGAAIRLGPAVRIEPKRKIGTGTTLEAFAALFARAQTVGPLLAALRRTTRDHVARRTHLAPDAETASLAAGIPRERDRRDFLELETLSERTSPSPADLLHAARLAAAVRKGLDHGFSRS